MVKVVVEVEVEVVVVAVVEVEVVVVAVVEVEVGVRVEVVVEVVVEVGGVHKLRSSDGSTYRRENHFRSILYQGLGWACSSNTRAVYSGAGGSVVGGRFGETSRIHGQGQNAADGDRASWTGSGPVGQLDALATQIVYRGSMTREAWQPIETAPKDRAILVYLNYHPATPGCGHQAVIIWEGKDPEMPWRYVTYRIRIARFVPTHWMELPPNPEPQRDAR